MNKDEPVQDFLEYSPKLKKIIENGIPVRKTVFQAAVNNADGTPENYFSDDSQNSSRRVNMWCTAIGIVCEHKGVYFRVPDANTIFSYFKANE